MQKENATVESENKPKLSIILPVHNNAKTIIRTVQSIRAQSFKNWELIIVNDGSTDATSTMLKPLINLDTRIRYLYQSEGGIAQASRQGVQMARAGYVAIISPDDNCLLYDFERYMSHLTLMPGLEGVIGRNVASLNAYDSGRTGLLIMKSEVLLDTAILYSRLDDLSAATLYRKLVRVGVIFGFIGDETTFTPDSTAGLFAASTAARRMQTFGQRINNELVAWAH